MWQTALAAYLTATHTNFLITHPNFVQVSTSSHSHALYEMCSDRSKEETVIVFSWTSSYLDDTGHIWMILRYLATITESQFTEDL